MREDLIDHSEECEIYWRQYLEEFEEKVLPVFEQRGYDRNTALQVWQLNWLRREIEVVQMLLTDTGEDWQTVDG